MENLRRIVAKAQRRSNRPLAVLANNGDANSYGVVANLGSEGVSVISVSSDPKNLTFRSRYAQGALCPDFATQEDDFIDYLEELGRLISQKPVLFANGDEVSLTLLRHRERLQDYYHLPFAPYELARQLTEKNAFYSLLEQHEIPHPRTWITQSLAEIDQVAAEIAYPCIIKPSQSQTFSRNFGNKCLRADSVEQLLEIHGRVSASEPEVVVQEMLQGTERYLVYNYFSQDGEQKAISTYRKERIFPIDFGNATACRSIVDTDLESLVSDLLRTLNYRGLGEAEIQRDARDGQLKVVEVNIRSTTQSRLSAACGVNMEYIAYQDMLGEPQEFVANRQEGVLWVDLYRDALAVLTSEGYRAKKGLRLTDWLSSLSGRRVFAICSLRDIKVVFFLIVWILKVHGFSRKRLKSLSPISASFRMRN